ncbi:TIR domain-containing protein [Nostoc sp. FACHB-152]|uniref:WD40 domain-containing protein n=1 Tax=unclassified Nostoc TaxID=2593658 RepID=UPI00168778C5|nr:MULTISPECIES: TIR domain-containing protein [unclassified Nostoc]MBD2449706.1 TIR domain-containing protein [Nostoc sp. FACHB-152]MBD2469074.1 TIR domain-containing protein [Nostoc sp. FACHB-145]
MENLVNAKAIPYGWQLTYELHEHNGLISRVEWSPNGEMLASASFDSTVKIWDFKTGKCIYTLKGHSGRVWAIVWSPDSKYIASGSADNTVRVWKVETEELIETFPMHTGVCLCMAWSPDNTIVASGGTGDDWSIIFGYIKTRKRQHIPGHSGQINSLAWSSDGKVLASASHDSTIRLWDKETTQLKKILRGHSGDVYSVAWSTDGRLLASSSVDNTIRLWNPQTGQTLFVLEGHTGSVNCVKFSHDSRFLASKSADGTVRLWRCDNWETVTVLKEETSKSLPFGLAFHPQKPILATLGAADTAIRVWKIDPDILLNTPITNPSALYRNAKVVLVGETGVGKSGLSLVLTNQEFRPTESTHGRHVWTFDKQDLQLNEDRHEVREILLWDLAGQPSYRLIHQLHLNELAVALIVIDARSETDPFAGVYYWNRALKQAQKLQGDGALSLKKILVIARTDRGSLSVNKKRIDALVQELGFDQYFETSAKEGWKIPELITAIREAIEWDNLPKVISTEVFQKIKYFLVQEEKYQRLLSPANDLYRAFLKHRNDLTDCTEVREQFDTCIGLVESRDLIRRLSFGNLILLQPELLDAYASAIINAAKDEPDGMGYIVEEDVLAARFRMPECERIADQQQEKLLLIATVQELIDREIALRVQTDPEPLLVFPSQLTREWPEAPDPEGKTVIFEFEGAVISVYTTLVIRLSRSEIFQRKEMWKNAAIFTTTNGGEYGIWLRYLSNIDEGKAELTLFFKPEASEEARLQFEKYVHTHLKRRALPDSIRSRRIFVCSECETPVTEKQAEGRRSRGYDFINCNVCDTSVSLLDSEENLTVSEKSLTVISNETIPKMDKAADTGRKIESKLVTNDFDVFLSHNSKDKPLVEKIANSLRRRGLNPWLDKEKIPVGQSFVDWIQKGIKQSKSAAVFISSHGLGDYQLEELRSLHDRRVKEKIPLIPILLPGVNQIPDDPEFLFLKGLNWVQFVKNMNEKKPLEDLIKGITLPNSLDYE